MADQGDKRRAKHQKNINKKRVVTRSRSRNFFTQRIESSDSELSSNDSVSLDSSSVISSFPVEGYFLGEASHIENIAVTGTADNLKRKHPDNSEKLSTAKKTKEISSKEKESQKYKSKSSKGKSKMSSSSSTSLNESLDNSTSDAASDFNILSERTADFTHMSDTSFESNEQDSKRDDTLSADTSEFLNISDSNYLSDTKETCDKSLNNTFSISSSPSCSLNRSESEGASGFPFSFTADNGNEIRELLRNELMSIRNSIGDTFLSSRPKRQTSVIHQRKKILNSDKKNDNLKDSFGDQKSTNTGSSSTSASAVPAGSNSRSQAIIDDSKIELDTLGANKSLTASSQTIDVQSDSDSKLVQVVKLNSSVLSKRSRHHASSKGGDSSKASKNNEELISGSLAAALDAADAAVASFDSSLQSSHGASGSSASNSDSNIKDNSELGRLQALLEARGIPFHVFGALGHRMHHLIHRSMGSSSNSRVQQLLQGLQATGDEGRQLQAVVELCQMLVMGNEDTLIGFPIKQVVPVLISLLSMEHNFEMMNNACRALTYLMEALPRSSSVVVDAVPVFLNKIQVIQCMDVAEQSLTALEMLSKWHNKAILRAKGVSICLTYLDFFSINSQRAALAIIANCFQNLLPSEFSLVQDSLPILSSWLARQDEKSVESICLGFSRLVDCFQFDSKYLKEIASQNLLSNILELLILSPSILSTQTFTTIMRMLALICASSPELAILLLNLNIAETLCYLLIGNSDNYNIKLTPRSHQELLEISFLICELMPCLPTDGIFSIDSVVIKHKNRKKDFVVWKWRDDSGVWQSYSVSDSKLIETAYQSGVDNFRHTEETSTGESVTTILDLNALQQISADSNTKRPLKRCLSSFYDAMLMNAEGSSSDKPDAKIDHFKENSEMVNNCIKSLFPVLYEIYCSSAGPSVRYNCLRAMLRMIYFAPPNVLEFVLKSQLLSRNIAAMLTSPDLKVLVSALQMAQLLIEKLPNVFGVHFIREGVMHEIRTLATVDISSRLTDTSTECLSPLSSNIFRSASSLLSSSKSFQFITSLQSSSQDSFQASSSSSSSSSSPLASSSKCIKKETSDANVAVKIIDLNKRSNSKDKESKKDSPTTHQGASCSLASDKHEKVNAWIKEMAKKFEEFFNVDQLEASHPAVNVLNLLTSAVSNLEAMPNNSYEALMQICNIMCERDISSFELIHSGLLTQLLKFLTVPPNSTQTEFNELENRLRTFLNIFIGSPLQKLFFDKLSLNPSPLVALIDKLNACIGHLEQFPVKVHDITSRNFSRRGTSALKFFNTHHLRCMFQRHPECNNLRQWRGGPVMIDPLASIHNIDQYLVSQGYGVLKSEDDDDDEDEEDDDDDDESDPSDDNSDENMLDIAAALRMNSNQESQKLQFLIGNNILPYNMSICQAIRQYGNTGNQNAESHDAESDDTLGLSNIWMKTHTIYYRPLPPDAPEVSKSNNEVVLTRSKTEKRKRFLSTHGKGSKKEEHKAEKVKTVDTLWYDGIVPETNPLLCFVTNIPESSAINDPSLEVIYLLQVIHLLNNQWGLLYQMNSWEPAVPQSLFINQKLTLKANRQLQDLISIMTGNVPAWLSQVAQEFPFLFPFQTRYLIFYVSSFDKDRALQRVIDVMPEVKNNDKITPKFDKRKRTISRDSILKQAESLLQDIANSKAFLEVQYKNEVGTGLGPTLEFYALVSKELQRADLEMWRGDKTVAQNGKGVPTNYVYNPAGLFPIPVSRNVKQNYLTKVCNRFKLLGNFLAKSVMDSRLLDIPLSLAFYKWMLNQEHNLSLSDIKYIDENLAQTVFKLEEIVTMKLKLEADSSLDVTAMQSALERLTFDGCSIEDLNLDFTVPGFPNIEMRKGGKDMTVNIHNLENYLKLLKHWIMKEGIWKQMKAFQEGFETVFPLKNLQIFYPDELELLFCGSEHTKWDVKSLMECCRSDHGYTHDSRAIKFLFDILCSYDQKQQRQFLQFITGSPRLPVGGLKSLSPPLTIVKKTSDDCTDSDNYLPSVMTCVNYLKLPDYSTIDIMRRKLEIAVNEGQLSFHLS